MTIPFNFKMEDPDFEERRKSHGVCEHCNKVNTAIGWCQPCDSAILAAKEWTSGNKIIDDFIRNSQNTANDYERYLEWIEYDRFEDIKEIGQGGFSIIYSATWLDGVKGYNGKKHKRYRDRSSKVVLRTIKGSQNISKEYMNEIQLNYDLLTSKYNFYYNFLPFYGFTKDPNTDEFMMISEYAEQGTIRNFLDKNFSRIEWDGKIDFLTTITGCLAAIHEHGICHKDLHTGNILLTNRYQYIADFGLSGPANETSKNIYGVLPYVAPEVLRGKPYTTAADIYSLGIIMTELSAFRRPFYDKKYDYNLASAICKGLRPEFGRGTPEIYKNLVNKCLDANPDNRPTASALHDQFFKWKGYLDTIDTPNGLETALEMQAIFNEANKEIPNIIKTSCVKHPDAIYVSKLLDFKNLENPTNPVKDFDHFDQSTTESAQIDLQLGTMSLNDLSVEDDDE